MTVTLNESGLEILLQSPLGPVGADLGRRAALVEEKARENASGVLLEIRTGDLLAGLSTKILTDELGLRAEVGTDAQHRDFDYPAYHDQTGRPWLTRALADVFT